MKRYTPIGLRLVEERTEGGYVRFEDAHSRIQTLEAALRGLLAQKDIPPFTAEAIEDKQRAWDAARKALGAP